MKIAKLPAINSSVCVKCHRCIDICPTKAIRVQHDPANNYSCAKCIKYCITMDVPCKPENIFFLYELCNSCGQCITACTHGALYWLTPEKAQINNTVPDNINSIEAI